jgi:hypothetical protein
MSRVDKWFSEEPRPRPAEVACRLARDKFWRDEQGRLLATHPDFPDVAVLLALPEELAHAVILVLSRVPQAGRLEFADRFYGARGRDRAGWVDPDPARKLALAAQIALLVVELADPELRDERIVDLLEGAGQGHDLSRTPAATLDAAQRAVAESRFGAGGLNDPADPRAAATLAIAEVLFPAGDTVALQTVAARAAYAAVESWEVDRTIEFLVAADRAFAARGA